MPSASDQIASPQASEPKTKSDPSALCTALIGKVRQIIAVACSAPSNPEIRTIAQTAIQEHIGEFYAYTLDWSVTERKKYLGKKDHADAIRLKARANEVMQQIQDNLLRFCDYLIELELASAFINSVLKATGGDPNIQWSGDMGVMLEKNMAEHTKNRIISENCGRAVTIIKEKESDYLDFEKTVTALLGKDKAQIVLNAYRSGLRMGDFQKSAEAVESVRKHKPLSKKEEAIYEEAKTQALDFLKTIETHADDLKQDDGKLMFRASEIELYVQTLEKETAQKRQLIYKYRRPYIRSRLTAVTALRDKLGLIGSLDGLMTLYLKMLRGLSRPLEDIKDVREYESAVIEPINHLLAYQFKELAVLEERLNETMTEFQAMREKFSQFLDSPE